MARVGGIKSCKPSNELDGFRDWLAGESKQDPALNAVDYDQLPVDQW